MSRSLIISTVTFTFFCVLFIGYAFMQKKEADTQRTNGYSNELEWNKREQELMVEMKRKDSTISLLVSRIDSLKNTMRK